jgi:hypothetical protein
MLDVTNYKLKAELVPNAIGDKVAKRSRCRLGEPYNDSDARDIVVLK